MLLGVIVLGATGIAGDGFRAAGARNQSADGGHFAGFLNVILFFPSGAIYPLESFPPWLQTFAHYNPETHAVSALKSILFKGAHFAAVADDVAFLTIFTIVMLLLASLTVKRTL